ncbi:CocE/NonD family hydrolase [Cytophagaceae bacterium YF14B1]|uniref:CocE/NonD family hydrolase n=1 Tax=Xanthocytophaga flava TaxID=3048013 RepID=A0AAE3U7D3_9BACT|nr:CocE/NonD family hydrolase [Xanthocytophaga flavus]MDJ1479554.1 CocE/NonD family hydrolase [Xanthocytophaga flavus]
MLKNILTVFFLFILIIPVFGQSSKEDSVFVRDNYTKLERQITMRDGIKLFTAIYVPKDKAQKYPFLMMRTPYSVGPYGEDKYPRRLGANSLLMREKYIFVYQDVRGRYMSEGNFEEMTPHKAVKKSKKETDESTDTYDTVEWLIKNVPGNNARVGLWGISYPGFYATASLPNAHPAIKAVSPQAPVTDEFIGDDAYHKGAFFLMDNFSFMNYFDSPRKGTVKEYEQLSQIEMKDAYEFYLNLGPLKNINQQYFKGKGKIWNEYLQNDTYNEYWKARNIRTHLTNVKPATLVVGGWFDAEDLFGALRTYEAIESQSPNNKNYLVMGPWTHGSWSREDWTRYGTHDFGQNTAKYYREQIETPFFNFFLKDKGTFTLPEATVFETGTNQWKQYEAFPPKKGTVKELYFLPGGKLSFEKSSEQTSFDEYISDPSKPVPYVDGTYSRRNNEYMTDDQRFASRRPDVLVYQTEVLTEDITLTGKLIADLFVSTTGTDADFIVKLIDVLPDNTPNPTPNPKGIQMAGYQQLVRAEVMRGRFRNSFEKPEAFVSGQVSQVMYELPDVAHTFPKGHRIMIQVQSSWFPLVDRNPQKYVEHIWEAEEADFQKATHRLYHSQQYPSHIKVTVTK